MEDAASSFKAMADGPADKVFSEQVETALLDAELFLKYKAPQRALARLHETLKQHSHSIRLRERIREVAPMAGQPEEAARQCLALVQLYITREDFDAAHERLLEAKQYDPRINIATGLEAIRRARRPDLQATPPAATAHPMRAVTFAGDLSVISIFDAVQVIENAKLTGALVIQGSGDACRIHFNEGRIVGAESGAINSNAGLRVALSLTDGAFDFERTAQPFPVTIQAHSNTNLMLDTLRELDEAKL
jgi:tetratricopeptide (TPR) repeat protein